MNAPSDPETTRVVHGGSRSPGAHEAAEVDLVDLARALGRHRRLMVVMPVAGLLLFAGLSLARPRTYTADATFLPHVSSSPVSNLAAQLGMSTGQGAGESPEFYASLLKTREIMRASLESEYAVSTAGGLRRGDVFTLLGSGEEPADSVDMLRWVDEAVAVRTNVEGTVTLEVTTTDPDLSEQIASRLLDLLGEFNQRHRQSRAAAERQFLEDRLREVERELRDAENEVQSFLQQNRQYIGSPELEFQHDRLRRVVAVKQRTFSELSTSFEQARLNEVRDVPLITIVEAAAGSARPDARGTILRGAFGMILFGTLTALGVLLHEFSPWREPGPVSSRPEGGA